MMMYRDEMSKYRYLGVFMTGMQLKSVEIPTSEKDITSF